MARKRPYVKAPFVFAGLAIVVGLTTLLGWAADLPLLTRVWRNWVAMQPLTAVTLVLAGAGLCFFASHRWRAAALTLVPLIAIPGTALLQRWTGRSLGIDSLLFPSGVLAQQSLPHPGRMAEIAATEFLLFALFLMWPRRTSRQYRRASRIATLGLLIALVGLGGYLLGALDLARVGSYTPMAVTAALGFAFLFLGALMAQRDPNWLHFVLKPSTGGGLTRRLLYHIGGWPIAVGLAIPIVQPLIWDVRLGFATYVACLCVAMVVAVVRFARRLDRAETQRDQAIAGLGSTRARLAGVLESTLDAVVSIDEDQRVVFFNPAAEKMFACRAADAVGSPVERFIPVRFRTAHAEHVRQFGETGITSRSMGGMQTLTALRCDGTEFPIDASISQTTVGAQKLFTVILRDVSERKIFEAQLRESESRLALALKAGETAVWDVDVATQRFRADDAFFTMIGYAPGEMTALSDWVSCVHDEDRQGIVDLIEEVVQGLRVSCRRELRLRAKDGTWHWILSQAIAADADAHGTATRLVGTQTDITERKLAEQRVREAALRDPLTGLPNRALVFEYGSHLLAAARRRHGHGALLFIDLDRFKPINDIYGHKVGDQVLQEVAQRLVTCTRKEDLVGRLGGDEFVIVLPHLDGDRHRAAVVAQHVIDRLSQPYRVELLELSLSPSIGISYYPKHATDIGPLIHAADLAMYQAKQAGRANYQTYAPELDRRADAAYSLEARLRKALKRGTFALHYQPVMDIENGRLVGAEALIRLADDDPPISPASFIPVAESAGLINYIGEWVVTEAYRQHETWLGEGLLIVVAVNVSPLQFRQRDFVERLRGIITDTGVDPTCLQLEVTESTIMESLDEAVEILNRIKALGVKVALDDFGTGYSSLSRLSSLPLDKLKVDQSFVQGIENDAASRAVTEAVIALGRSLKLEVVGEGIESEHVLHYLREQGCNQAQGYWISQPLPASDFVRWHRQRRLH